MEGTVVRIIEDRAFGFIKPANGGKDLFFHRTELQDGLEFDARLLEMRVQFEVGLNNKDGRERAVAVRAAR